MKYFLVILMIATDVVSAKASVINRQVLKIEQWHATMARAVAFQPRAVGVERYFKALGFALESKEGRKFIAELSLEKNLPVISTKGNVLKFESVDGTLTLEPTLEKPDEFLINNEAFHLDAKRPVLPQVKDFLNGQKNQSKVSWFFSSAFAEDRSASKVGTSTLGASLLSGTIASVSALGTTTALGVAASGVVVVGSIGVAAGSLACSGPNVTQREFLNCMTTPLTWLGINPRDKVFLSSIECESTGPKVTVESDTGIIETRVFHEVNGRLQKIILDGNRLDARMFVSSNGLKFESAYIDSSDKKPANKLTRPQHAKKLDEAQGLLTDYQFYKGLCADKSRLREFRKLVEFGTEKGPRAHDSKSSEAFLKGTR